MEQQNSMLSDVVVRVRWYIRLRWLLLLVITIPGLLSLYVGSGWTAELVGNGLFALATFASNGIWYVLGHQKRSSRYYRNLGVSIVVLDVMLITFFIYTMGGIESRSVVLYSIPILMSAAIFGRKAVYLTSLIAALSYDILIMSDYLNIIHSLDTVTNQRSDFAYVINSIIFFTAVLCIVGFLADYITNLLIVKERQATENEAALKRAQAIAKLGSWEWDIVADKISWSEELHRIFGVAHQKNADTTYQGYLKRLPEDDREQVRSKIAKALKDNKPFSFEHRVMRSDNTVHYVHGEGQVVTNRQGKPIKMYGTTRDITAERSLDAAKGDFVSLASHQLRTPATGVKVLLGLLTDGYAGKLSRKQQDLIQQAYDANERQLRIANDLLNIARVESGRLLLRKKRIDVKKWVESTLTDQHPQIQKRNQKLILDLEDSAPKIAMDPDRMYMALDNLINNASKYTAPEGIITVSLSTTKSLVRISVNDTGIGISKSEIPKLFNKFTRIDNRLSTEVEGSGLGLYLAKSIVTLHKGTIKVRSKPGVGTTFTIELPKYQAIPINQGLSGPANKAKSILKKSKTNLTGRNK